MWATFASVLSTACATILTRRVTYGHLTELSSVSYCAVASVRCHASTTVFTRLAADRGCTCRAYVAARSFTSVWVDAQSTILAGRVTNRCLATVTCEGLRTFAGVRCNTLPFVLVGKGVHSFTVPSSILKDTRADVIFGAEPMLTDFTAVTCG